MASINTYEYDESYPSTENWIKSPNIDLFMVNISCVFSSKRISIYEVIKNVTKPQDFIADRDSNVVSIVK